MNQHQYKAVVFDLDGTLLNTLEDLRDSVNYGLEKNGMPKRSLEEIRRFVGNGVGKLIERAVPRGTTKDEEARVFAAFKEHYAVHCNDKTDLYPGIREMLSELKKRGYLMAIVSNKLQSGVDALSELYFKDFTKVAVGGREDMPKKPAPDMVFEALRQLAVTKDEAVFVGDSEVDIATAGNAGMDCITVAWGFRSRQEQEKAGAKVFVNSPMEIVDLL